MLVTKYKPFSACDGAGPYKEVGKCDQVERKKDTKGNGALIAIVIAGTVYTYILSESHVLYIIFF